MTTSQTTSSEQSAFQDPRRWRTLALLGIAQLMLIVDVTVVAIALPDMGADLGLDRAGLTWVASIYALVFGGLMLLGGKAADVVGPRRLVLAGLALFAAASLLAGLASNGELLLLARALQGVGAAAMSPAALSVIVRTFTGAELSRALGVWSALGGAGAAVGVLLGGVLTAGPGWPWVFYINVPVGAVLLLALLRSLRPLPGSGGRLDLVGAGIATVATGSIVYGLVTAGDHGWISPQTLIAGLVGLAGYALFVWRISTASAPLVDPSILRRRPVLRGLGLIFVATALMIAVFFLGSFALQQLHGFTALETGLSFLPIAAGTIAGSNLAGRVLPRSGVRAVSAVGLLVAAAGLAAAAGIDSVAVLVVATSVAGFGIGAAFVAAAASMFSAVQPHEAGVASGALSTFHEFGAATGVSAVSSVAAAALLDPSFAAFAPGYWFAAAVAAIAGVALVDQATGSLMRAGMLATDAEPLAGGRVKSPSVRRCVAPAGTSSLGTMRTTSPSSGSRTTQDAVVSVRGLSKSYGGTLVVDNLDLDVFPGEVVGLIGANGAGKTTVVECLQGLRHPDEGHIRVLGLDPAEDAQRMRALIGSQLQDSGLPDRMRVSEAVTLFAGPEAVEPAALMTQFGIAHRARTPYAGLSGGERQRLFLVLALLNQPQLVILDELTQGLDPAARRNVWSAVDQLRRDGVTVLLVTHELSEAEALCDRVIAMRAGKVLDQGTPAQLIARHAGQAIIRFSLPASGDTTTAAALQELNRLPEVQTVTRTDQTITVRGGRAVIAHVGAWLAARPGPIPLDLDVDVPDLEAALLTLLSRTDSTAGATS